MNTMVADHDSDVVVDDGRDELPRRLRKKQKLAAQTSEESSSAAFLAPHTAHKSQTDLEHECDILCGVQEHCRQSRRECLDRSPSHSPA